MTERERPGGRMGNLVMMVVTRTASESESIGNGMRRKVLNPSDTMMKTESTLATKSMDNGDWKGR